MLTPDETLTPINMMLSPRMSFTSPKVCTATKPQFNFIYNSLSVVSPICSMTSPCQLFTETLQKLHSPFSMKMPPENIDILNLLMNKIMKNATVAPSAEPPRITSKASVVAEDSWTVAMVHAEAIKFNMLSISRHHRPGHWKVPDCIDDDLDLVVTTWPCWIAEDLVTIEHGCAP